MTSTEHSLFWFHRVTTAGCCLTFTRSVEDDDVVHIAISQIGRHTTHAVGGHLAFLVIQVLRQNRARADLFYSNRLVHHVVLVKGAGSDWITEDAATVLEWMERYEPLPFQFRALPAG